MGEKMTLSWLTAELEDLKEQAFIEVEEKIREERIDACNAPVSEELCHKLIDYDITPDELSIYLEKKPAPYGGCNTPSILHAISEEIDEVLVGFDLKQSRELGWGEV